MCKGRRVTALLDTVLFADGTVAERESDLQTLYTCFESVCNRWKLMVAVNKSKVHVMVFEKNKSEVVYFDCPYRVYGLCDQRNVAIRWVEKRRRKDTVLSI